MSDRQKIIEETKKQISSLLVSLGASRGKPGIPTKQFHNDYRDIIGTTIPYRELGYSALDDFFRDIPDTVYLQWERGIALVKLVENDSIRHIVDLVDSQKTVVSKKRQQSRRSRGGGSSSRGYYSTPSRYGGQGYGSRRNESRYNQTPRNYSSGPSNVPPRLKRQDFRPDNQWEPRWEPDRPTFGKAKTDESGFIKPPDVQKEAVEPLMSKPSVPALIRGMVRELLISYPNGIFGVNVESAYSKRFGQSLSPYKFGFKSMFALLSSIDDIIDIEEFDDDYRIYQKKLKPVALHETSRQEASSHKVGSSGDNTKSKIRTRKVNDYLNDTSEDNGPGAIIRGDIKEVLDRNQDGVWASRFPNIFEAHTGVPLPWRELSYQSVIELMADLPEEVAIVRDSPTDWRLYAVQHAPKRKVPKSPPKQDINNEPKSPTRRKVQALNVGAELQNSVQQVLLCHPEGLPLHELPETFKSMTGKDLEFKSFGFGGVEAFAEHLSSLGILKITRRGEGLILLEAANNGSPVAKSYLLDRPGLGKYECHVPEDAVGAGIGYPLLKYPQWEPTVYDTEVLVSMVISPSMFWLQLKGVNTTDALEDLMDELEYVYDSRNSKSYKMPDYMMTKGQVCVAKYPMDENWHRGTIVSVSLDFAEVYFVDYGTFCSVHKSNLRLLKSRFLHLPVQALQARLALVRPIAGAKEWAPRATQRVLELTANHAVLATVLKVDENKVLSVCLCDTSGVDDIHVGDVLVEEGWAEVCDGEELESVQSNSFVEQEATEMKPAETSYVVPNDSQADNVAYVTPMKRGPEISKQKEDAITRNVKFVELTTEHSIHLVKFENTPYVLSAEISAFFWEKDLLRTMMRQKRLELPRKVLAYEGNEEMFKEFEEEHISGVLDGDGMLKKFLTMYPLTSVLSIMDAFGNRSLDLRIAVEREIQTFNPDDPHWKGEGEDDDLRSCSDITEDSDYKSEELERSLHVLNLRRKKLVQDMVTQQGGASAAALETELRELEERIAVIQNMLRDSRTKQGKAPTEEEFIQTCVAKQYSNNNKFSAEAQQPLHPMSSQAPAPAPAPAPQGFPNPMMPTMAAAAPAMPRLSAEQQQFLMRYNMLLSQQLLDNQALMGGGNPAFNPFTFGQSGVMPGMMAPGMAPGMMPGGVMPGMMPPGMPGLNPMAGMQDSMAGMTIGDMSSVVLGMGRGMRNKQTYPSDPNVGGGFYQGPQNM